MYMKGLKTLEKKNALKMKVRPKHNRERKEDKAQEAMGCGFPLSFNFKWLNIDYLPGGSPFPRPFERDLVLEKIRRVNKRDS